MSGMELKPCPFCGGEAAMVKQRRSGRTRDIVNAFVRCKSCGARSKNVSSLHVAERNLEAYAAKSWNRRAERTCRAVGRDLKPYEPDPEHSLLDAACGRCGGYLGGREQSHVGEYCPECDARVVEP